MTSTEKSTSEPPSSTSTPLNVTKSHCDVGSSSSCTPEVKVKKSHCDVGSSSSCTSEAKRPAAAPAKSSPNKTTESPRKGILQPVKTSEMARLPAPFYRTDSPIKPFGRTLQGPGGQPSFVESHVLRIPSAPEPGPEDNTDYGWLRFQVTMFLCSLLLIMLTVLLLSYYAGIRFRERKTGTQPYWAEIVEKNGVEEAAPEGNKVEGASSPGSGPPPSAPPQPGSPKARNLPVPKKKFKTILHVTTTRSTKKILPSSVGILASSLTATSKNFSASYATRHSSTKDVVTKQSTSFTTLSTRYLNLTATSKRTLTRRFTSSSTSKFYISSTVPHVNLTKESTKSLSTTTLALTSKTAKPKSIFLQTKNELVLLKNVTNSTQKHSVHLSTLRKG